ncbi:hypothetical protein DNK57_00065 [Methanothermobacter thermautotrophicus]|jgi:hypothetical protein|uniref:Uncharacterized protein n=1 Tax=Methanothermobacter thermautotrophicus TaxID=145262 RepID=A0A842YLE4_METTF|nr:hypothetical protein [Methanothermobacter thermautotrophicus]MBE2899231.1 hypothetical protein [Methanothermobacter thermautotrophicus]MCQ8904604.1 hypothetical protein [Methanothermobacter sp.]
MIYLIITLAGILMIFAGLYFMSLGFATPPDIFMFFLGLILFVPGLIITLLFAGKVDLKSIKTDSGARKGEKRIKTETARPPVKSKVTGKTSAAESGRPRRVPEMIKGGEKTGATETIKSTREAPERKQGPVGPVRVKHEHEEKTGSIKVAETADKKLEVKGSEASTTPRIKPSRVSEEIRGELAEKPDESHKTTRVTEKPPIKPAPIRPMRSAPEREIRKKSEVPPSKDEEAPKRKFLSLPKIRRGKEKEETRKPSTVKPPRKETPAPPKPGPARKPADNSYVTERLQRLKQEYIENVDDVEDLLEDRLDSFKGAINRIRAETREPSIIWSFDASDVQDAMRETITAAEESVVLMYPWIRNIDVSVLKKFMDTESRLIIQEASLDDEASVELIKVLVDNNVQIRTMPHIHTVAAVADDKNGLIISTDPIYESFEVGVIYKDKKSISEIKKLFEEAWELSNEINLEGV